MHGLAIRSEVAGLKTSFRFDRSANDVGLTGQPNDVGLTGRPNGVGLAGQPNSICWHTLTLAQLVAGASIGNGAESSGLVACVSLTSELDLFNGSESGFSVGDPEVHE